MRVIKDRGDARCFTATRSGIAKKIADACKRILNALHVSRCIETLMNNRFKDNC